MLQQGHPAACMKIRAVFRAMRLQQTERLSGLIVGQGEKDIQVQQLHRRCSHTRKKRLQSTSQSSRFFRDTILALRQHGRCVGHCTLRVFPNDSVELLRCSLMATQEKFRHPFVQSLGRSRILCRCRNRHLLCPREGDTADKPDDRELFHVEHSQIWLRDYIRSTISIPSKPIPCFSTRAVSSQRIRRLLRTSPSLRRTGQAS